MNKLLFGFLFTSMCCVFISCQQSSNEDQVADNKSSEDFEYVMDRFADLQILKYRVPGFDELDLQKKKLAYYLYQAALCGRDIIYDQNYKHNLRIRKTIETIYFEKAQGADAYSQCAYGPLYSRTSAFEWVFTHNQPTSPRQFDNRRATANNPRSKIY